MICVMLGNLRNGVCVMCCVTQFVYWWVIRIDGRKRVQHGACSLFLVTLYEC